VGEPTETQEAGTLKDRAQVQSSIDQVRKLGLPVFGDAPKNWDSLVALRAILKRTKRTARILDAGAEVYSVILPWLALYGYQDLVGNNLVFRAPRRIGPILYEQGDITKTKYPDASFDGVTCLSVIEHNVDLPAFFREMSRIMKPGAPLVVSTDYYESPTDTTGKTAYGGPVKIFDADGVRAMLAEAKRHGLVEAAPIDMTCTERCVTWERVQLSYTFIAFTLIKQS
jgi:SAM-dependent methyltransferase